MSLNRVPNLTGRSPATPGRTEDDNLAAAVQELKRQLTDPSASTKREFCNVHSEIERLYASSGPRTPRTPATGSEQQSLQRQQQPKQQRQQSRPTQQQQQQHKQLTSNENPHHQQLTQDEQPSTLPGSACETQETRDTVTTNVTKQRHSTIEKPQYSSVLERIVGTATNKKGLSVSPRPRDIYVGGLGADTTPTKVMDYVLENIGIRVPCRQIKTKNESYSSFVISVDRNHLERVFNPVLWPAEAIVDHYKPPRAARRWEYQRSERTERNNRTEWSANKQYRDSSDEYYARQYDEHVYDDCDIRGHRYTGRDNRYLRRRSGDGIDNC